jgi:hypothetical protein
VRVKQIKLDLTRLVDEASGVKKTLERSDADAQAVIADKNASKSAKATAQARSTAAKAASANLDSEVDQAKRALTDMDTRTEKLEKDYGASFDALEKALKDLPKK